MKVLHLSLTYLFFSLCGLISAQGTPVPATDDSEAMEMTELSIEELTEDEPVEVDTRQGSMIEIGLSPSYTWVGGDVDPGSGYGISGHVRKSLDHLFSIRLDGLYANSSGDNLSGSNANNRRFESRMLSGTGYAVVTLNNFTFRGDIRKVNIFAMVGAGANFFETEAQANGVDYPNLSERGLPFDEENAFSTDSRNAIVEQEFAAHAAAGAGINFRISSRFNVGLEYQAIIPLGNRADLIDGYDSGSNFRDIQNVASVALNFNIGNASRNTEPRYWTNVFTPIRQDLEAMSGRINDAMTDSDGDGVVDAVDQEANTPPGVPVDTRGRVLDSDQDGVADYKDLEPFFPPRAGEAVDENGVVMNRTDKPVTEERVQQMIDASLERYRQENGGAANTTTVRTDFGEIYLPMITFPLGQARIKYSDYGVLSSVARVLQANPGMNMVIRGYTDRTGSASNNEVLSYRRASNVIDHLVNNHGIDPNRFVLQYRGEDNAIVPQDRSFVNRRVEFLTNDGTQQEDPAPAGYENDRGGY